LRARRLRGLRRLGAGGVAREILHRVWTRLPVRLLPGGWAPPVYSLAWWLTERCNLACSMCWVHGERRTPMAPEHWLRLADQVRRWKPRITFTGGEPSLYPQALELAEGVKARGLYLSFNTNGLRLSEMAPALVRIGVDDVSVSLDGMAGAHDTVRGRPGSWARAVEGLRALLGARGGRGWPIVRVTTVLAAGTVEDLEPLHRLVAELGVDCHTLQHRWFVAPSLWQSHRQQAERRLGIDSSDMLGLVWDDPAPIPGLRRLVDRLRGLGLGTRLELSPELRAPEWDLYYLAPERALREACTSRWHRMTILPDGQATPCLGFVSGSVREEPFARIWNGARMRRFRRDLVGNGIFPGCLRCCGLFSDR